MRYVIFGIVLGLSTVYIAGCSSGGGGGGGAPVDCNRNPNAPACVNGGNVYHPPGYPGIPGQPGWNPNGNTTFRSGFPELHEAIVPITNRQATMDWAMASGVCQGGAAFGVNCWNIVRVLLSLEINQSQSRNVGGPYYGPQNSVYIGRAQWQLIIIDGSGRRVPTRWAAGSAEKYGNGFQVQSGSTLITGQYYGNSLRISLQLYTRDRVATFAASTLTGAVY